MFYSSQSTEESINRHDVYDRPGPGRVPVVDLLDERWSHNHDDALRHVVHGVFVVASDDPAAHCVVARASRVEEGR